MAEVARVNEQSQLEEFAGMVRNKVELWCEVVGACDSTSVLNLAVNMAKAKQSFDLYCSRQTMLGGNGDMENGGLTFREMMRVQSDEIQRAKSAGVIPQATSITDVSKLIILTDHLASQPFLSKLADVINGSDSR